MDINLKELKGYSGDKVVLMTNNDYFFVRKFGKNNHRNIERLVDLKSKNIEVPDIINVQDTFYDMEYIPNLDIKTYLSKNPTNNLVEFLLKIIGIFKHIELDTKDFTDVYNSKLSGCDLSSLPFSKDALIDKLPKLLPVTTYHGDLTLENILYNTKTDSFFLIDPLMTEYNSYVFDLAKLRQDVICQWFIRNDNYYLQTKLNVINNSLNQFEYYNNDYLLILMLLRVLPYTKTIDDKHFITGWITKLWK